MWSWARVPVDYRVPSMLRRTTQAYTVLAAATLIDLRDST